jgi:di/tripeptidase
MSFGGEDPVAAGWAKSYARPGGNVTGVVMLSPELDGKRFQANVEAQIDRDYDRMHVPDDSAIVRLVQAAAKNLRVELQTLAWGGGCDANVLNRKGLEVANLSTGMRDIHTVNEWLDLKDLYLSAEMVLEIVRLNGASH